MFAAKKLIFYFPNSFLFSCLVANLTQIIRFDTFQIHLSLSHSDAQISNFKFQTQEFNYVSKNALSLSLSVILSLPFYSSLSDISFCLSFLSFFFTSSLFCLSIIEPHYSFNSLPIYLSFPFFICLHLCFFFLFLF